MVYSVASFTKTIEALISSQNEPVHDLANKYTVSGSISNLSLEESAGKKNTELFKRFVSILNDKTDHDPLGIFKPKTVEFLRLMGATHYLYSDDLSQAPYIIKTTARINKAKDRMFCLNVRLMPKHIKNYISSFLMGPENRAIVLKSDNAALTCLIEQKNPSYTLANLVTTPETRFKEILSRIKIKNLDFSGCITLNNHQLKRIVDACPELTTLNLTNCRNITKLPWNSAVEILDISGTGIKYLHPLQSWQKLRELRIYNCKQILSLVPNLTVEKFVSNKLKIRNYFPLMSWKNLKQLEIENSIYGIAQFPNKLPVIAFKVSNSSLRSLGSIGTWPSLKILTLDECDLGDSLPIKLPVEELTLGSTQYSIDLFPVASWKNLKSLKLKNYKTISTLPYNFSVQTLSLDNIKQVKDLSALESWKNFQFLNVKSSNLDCLPANLKLKEFKSNKSTFKNYSAMGNWDLMKAEIDEISFEITDPKKCELIN